ncbi:MAG: hypothetical protein LBE92_01160 [Chryseobacterium sp.]|uniref:hypothetical protein n=1 Tax=Chryseobacterium sp. TaxID=1871047 RepID=UPI00282B4F7C|nr:hypothetical protein [Chryseobacterium sp.]MDR2234707.1 hypothetical protein [Chryseobacterium sp.]
MQFRQLHKPSLRLGFIVFINKILKRQVLSLARWIFTYRKTNKLQKMITNDRISNNSNTTNNISYMLFGFISTINPQFAETKKENLRFIHCSGLNNAFDQAVKNIVGISKLPALEKQGRSFSSPLTRNSRKVIAQISMESIKNNHL